MQKEEWGKIVTLLSELWSRWEFSDTEIGIWKNRLAKFDFRAVDTAIRDYYASPSNTRNRPNLSKIICGSAKLNRKFRKPAKRKTPEPAFILKCTGSGAHFGKGTEFPVHIPGSYRGSTHRIAENERHRHEKLYGGKWDIINLWVKE